MLSSFTCLFALIHLFNSAVVSQVANGGASTSKGDATVYYVQRDGRVMKTKEGSLNRTEIADPFLMHYPVGETGSAESTALAPKNVKIVHTNALIQHLSNGTKVGDLVHGKTAQKAYPWNPIVSESPATMKKKSLRPIKSIDRIIEKTAERAASHYPTKSGQILTELDIVMTNAQYRYYHGGHSLIQKTQSGGPRYKRKALRHHFTYWPGAVIPYTVDSSFSGSERRLLQSAMKDWMDKTCIRFVPAGPEHNDYISIQNGQGCNSFVGRIGGRQSLNLEPSCREYHVMKHELGHVIGLIHEHQRPDRDKYIVVARENVGAGRLKNYRKFASNRINTYDVEYDYTSIMHYGKTAFSKDDVSTTMITRNPDFQEIIGTTSSVSFKDAKIVNAMYECSGHCSRRPACGIGYVDENCRCACPDGTRTCTRNVRRRFRPRDRFAIRRRLRDFRRRRPNQGLRRERQRAINEGRRQQTNFRGFGSTSPERRRESFMPQFQPSERARILQHIETLLRTGGTLGSGQTHRQRAPSFERQPALPPGEQDLGSQDWWVPPRDHFAADFGFNNPDFNQIVDPNFPHFEGL